MENEGYDDGDTEMTTSTSTSNNIDNDATQSDPSMEEMSFDDSDIDDNQSEGWESITSGYESSGTDDLDFLFFRDDDSDQSDDSSTADDDDFHFYEMLNHHIETLSHLAPTFFGLTLQMIYERIIGNLDSDEEKRTPASKRVLDSLERVKISEQDMETNSSCCVCFVEYVLNEEIVRLPCAHIYHKDCIFSWLKITSTCPTCRGDVKETSSTKKDDNDVSLNVNNIQGHFNNDTIRIARTSSRTNTLPSRASNHTPETRTESCPECRNDSTRKLTEPNSTLIDAQSDNASEETVHSQPSKSETQTTGKTRLETDIW